MKTTLTVKGMHCNSCKMLIEDILGDIPGIKSSNVDPKTGKTVIEHDDSVDMDQVKKEIEDAGEYTVA
jgi:copper chaperone CopZ